MTSTPLRDEICRVGRSLYERGYVHATAGNISVRLAPGQGGGFLITPTDACLGTLDPAALAHVGDDGTQLSGERASKTLALHRAIYEASSRTAAPAACVVHTHSTHSVALTLAPPAWRHAGVLGPELLAPITPYFVMKVGHVPLVAYRRPGHPDVARDVAATIARYAQAGLPLRAVMLDRLGPNGWGATPAAAMAALEELEETARLACVAQGRTEPLGAQALDELREAFGASW
jgi:ribulose-5-phosphate 4-epimerase/fuculose-1-phosphate aldolase